LIYVVVIDGTKVLSRTGNKEGLPFCTGIYVRRNVFTRIEIKIIELTHLDNSLN